ncbi:MAG: hypothetical protein LBM02_05095, partial [Lachnospiraceae bacterium]|nr:hypothetical protein [Lachnospiraceae bacterium]
AQQGAPNRVKPAKASTGQAQQEAPNRVKPAKASTGQAQQEAPNRAKPAAKAFFIRTKDNGLCRVVPSSEYSDRRPVFIDMLRRCLGLFLDAKHIEDLRVEDLQVFLDRKGSGLRDAFQQIYVGSKSNPKRYTLISMEAYTPCVDRGYMSKEVLNKVSLGIFSLRLTKAQMRSLTSYKLNL